MKANLSQRYGEHTLKTQQLDTKTTHLMANIDYRQYINLHQNLFTTTGTPFYTESKKWDRKERSYKLGKSVTVISRVNSSRGVDAQTDNLLSFSLVHRSPTFASHVYGRLTLSKKKWMCFIKVLYFNVEKLITCFACQENLLVLSYLHYDAMVGFDAFPPYENIHGIFLCPK